MSSTEQNARELQKFLKQIRNSATDEAGKGCMFEKLVVGYLRNDSQYDFDDVWRWSEWPDRWGADSGIDIVARERETGDYLAIQCKFFKPEYTIQKANMDFFFWGNRARSFPRGSAHTHSSAEWLPPRPTNGTGMHRKRLRSKDRV